MDTFSVEDFSDITRSKILGNDESSYITVSGYSIPTLVQRRLINEIVGRYKIVAHIGGYGFWSLDLASITEERLILGETNDIAHQNNVIMIENLGSRSKKLIRTMHITDPVDYVKNITSRLRKITRSLLFVTLEPPLRTTDIIRRILKTIKENKYSGSVWILIDKDIASKLRLRKENIFLIKSTMDTDRGMIGTIEHTFYTTDKLSQNHIFTDKFTVEEAEYDEGLCVWMF